MSLRILFADDSMTAQNMGKKILSEAGYDVVAVSNGAAAVKKIAEHKPDIIILDVYMPGYSGLEVCEKVRGSLDTLKIPVLLTVGKMEPLVRPEDANRVKADGVIIKPFEATDLLAIIRKFEERIGNAPPPPMVQQTAAPESQEDEAANALAEAAAQQQPSRGKPSGQPMVEVPDHMAGSAAFGDFLGSEPVNDTPHFAVNTPSAAFETSVIVPAPPVPVTDQDIPSSWRPDASLQPEMAAAVETVEAAPESATEREELAGEIVATPVEIAPDPELVTEEAAAAPAVESSEPAHAPYPPPLIPVFKEPELAGSGYELLHTAAPPIRDLEIPREPALQETADEVTRNTVVDHVEPGLMSTIGQQMDSVSPGNVEASAAEAVSSGVAEANLSGPSPAVGATSGLNEADFEARVAAAMAAYHHGTETEAANAHAAGPEAAVAREEAAPHAEPEPESPQVPSFEYQPAAGAAESAPHSGSMESLAAPAAAAAHAEYASSAPSASEIHAVAAKVETALPEVAAAAAAESDDSHQSITQAVHRAMERLKPDLVEAIMKELKAKK